MMKPPYYEQAEKKVAEAFRLIGEARRDLTILEFEHYIRRSLRELGSQGFVESIGRAITDAATK
jgi:hypothetical protein